MVLKLKKAPVATTGKKTSHKGETIAEEQEQEQVGQAVDLPEPHATVRVLSSYTHNLGDFNSVKISVGIDVPCEVENINDTFEFAKEWVDERLTAAVEELTAE